MLHSEEVPLPRNNGDAMSLDKIKSELAPARKPQTKAKTYPGLRPPCAVVLLCLIGTAAGLALPTETQSTSWLARTRRDENEGSENKHRTASVGFYIGDPCNQTCSRVLYHVFCNVTSRRCECRPEYPVNIRNRQCVKASPLDSACEYDEACSFAVTLSFCDKGGCRCRDGHEPEAHGTRCVPTRGVAILDNAELTTMVSVIVALMVFTALFCLVLRLFSKARFGSSGRDRMGDAASPSPGPTVLSAVDGKLASSSSDVLAQGASSRRPSRGSVDYGGGQATASRRASYGMLAPPAGDSAGCSRRASGSSLRSQTSQRSVASTRGSSVSKSGGGGDGATSSGSNARNHDPVRSTSSSPLDGNGAAASGRQEQPITRTLRLHLSQDMRDKGNCGYDGGSNYR